MLNPIQIEAAYKAFADNITNWAHDGITQIDLKFLHESGLLKKLEEEPGSHEDITQYFHVIESADKVTLFNDQFVVWIIPKMDIEVPITCAMIALNQPEQPQLEVVFVTKGIYNTPRYVLKVLQHFLTDMLETEETLVAIQKKDVDPETPNT